MAKQGATCSMFSWIPVAWGDQKWQCRHETNKPTTERTQSVTFANLFCCCCSVRQRKVSATDLHRQLNYFVVLCCARAGHTWRFHCGSRILVRGSRPQNRQFGPKCRIESNFSLRHPAVTWGLVSHTGTGKFPKIRVVRLKTKMKVRKIWDLASRVFCLFISVLNSFGDLLTRTTSDQIPQSFQPRDQGKFPNLTTFLVCPLFYVQIGGDAPL